MISLDLIMWLDDNYGPSNYGVRLQDYTDAEISEMIKVSRPGSRAELIGMLLHEAEMGSEKYAHLLGFVSADSRKRLIDAIEREKEKLK